MVQIYLSYSAGDRTLAHTIKQYLETNPNLSVWMDIFELKTEDDWWSECKTASLEADVIIGIASSNAILLNRILEEWKSANQLFLVSRISPIEYAREMPEEFTVFNVQFEESKDMLDTLEKAILRLLK